MDIIFQEIYLSEIHTNSFSCEKMLADTNCATVLDSLNANAIEFVSYARLSRWNSAAS